MLQYVTFTRMCKLSAKPILQLSDNPDQIVIIYIVYIEGIIGYRLAIVYRLVCMHNEYKVYNIIKHNVKQNI